MGLRTFIKSKLGRNEKDDANGASASKEKPTSTTPTKKKKKPKVPSTTTAKALVEEKPKGLVIPTQPPPPPKKQLGGLSREQVTASTTTSSSSSSSNKDSRLPPLRHESVKDRLNRVRSGKMTDDEKQAFLRTALSAGDTSTSRKPLRQELADESRPMNSTGNATPMPKDSLLSNMARGWGNGKNSTGLDSYASIRRNYQNGAQLEDQKKKREYFEMVTNPDRFHTYKSSMVTAPGETDKVDPAVHDGLIIPEMGMDDEDDERTSILEEEVIEEIREYEQAKGVEGDLGTRLEIAAHALEEAARQREKERKEKEARIEQQRQEQKKRLAEIQKKQQLEMEKRELELKAKKREEEEAKARETERKRKEEEARRRKLEEAQDAYWAKKLEKEKQERLSTMSATQKAQFVKHEVQAEEKALEITEHERKALEAEKRALEAAAAERKREDAVEARIDIAAADYLSKETKPDAYEAIREKKRRESEQARDEQIARLKALNSPLPAPRKSPTMSPVVPPASFAARSASEFSNLRTQPQPAPASAAMPKSEPTIAELMKDIDDTEMEEAKGVKSSDNSGFFSRVMGKKENSAPKAAPERKRVVRQQLPLGDQQDGFDTFDRNGPNRKMSIADAMKASGGSSSGGDQEQRSKMWGVDMSRIAKSLEDENK
jgi:hypothetical protein